MSNRDRNMNGKRSPKNNREDCKTGNSNTKRKDNRSSKHKSNQNTRKEDMPMNLKGNNDVSWYVYSQEILNSTANLYFPAPLGVPVPETNVTVPGLMVFNWSPTYGGSENMDANAPMNVAKNALYAFVRHENSGSKNYEASDLFMYMLAMDSLYALYYEARRVYGLTKLYSHTNRYYPRRVIEALGWNANDVIQNSAKLQAALNNAAFALGSFAVPGDLALFKRHKFLATNVFVDDVGAKAQSYVFKMRGYWKWEGFTDPNGTQLVYEYLDDTFTVDSWVSKFMGLINTYLADEDVGIMTGDMLKAFGKDHLLYPEGTDVGDITVPVFDAEIATQIQNIVCVGQFVHEDKATKITQYQGLLQARYEVYSPCTLEIEGVKYSSGFWGGVLNIPADNPTPADVMVATQLANIASFSLFSVKPGSVSTSYIRTCSSEVVHDITVVTGATGDVTTGNLWPTDTQGNCITLLDSASSERHIYFLNNVTKFRWHPYVYASSIISEIDENNNKVLSLDYSLSGVCMGDAQNMAGYTVDWLDNRNRVALYTMLNSSYMGVFNPAK